MFPDASDPESRLQYVQQRIAVDTGRPPLEPPRRDRLRHRLLRALR